MTAFFAGSCLGLALWCGSEWIDHRKPDDGVLFVLSSFSFVVNLFWWLA